MITIDIRYSEIPSYLHAGDFYRNLDSDDPEGFIQIPAECFHRDGATAANLKEFHKLLKVMVFWMLDDIPLGVLKFCNEHEAEVWGEWPVSLPSTTSVEVQPLLLTAYSNPKTVPLFDIIKTGRWDLIIHAVDRIKNAAVVTAVAAEVGHLRLLAHLHDEGSTWHEDTCCAASQNGHLDCLQYAHENGCPWDVRVHLNAAAYGHLPCMQYAFKRGLEWHVDVCKYAALRDQVDCLRFAHQNACPWDNQTTKCAAQEGHVDCLQYALEHGCPVDTGAFALACRGGHVECLKLLRRHGVGWDTRLPLHAAYHHSASCLKFLHENGCPWDEDTTTAAATMGHVEPLRYAMEHGCPYTGFIMTNVARSNSLQCLQYLVEEQGLWMNKLVFKTALVRGDLACLQYLLDQGCPFLEAQFTEEEEEWEIIDKIFQKDNPEFVLCVEFAVQRGWPLCKNFINRVVSRDELCRQWLISEGYYSESAM